MLSHFLDVTVLSSCRCGSCVGGTSDRKENYGKDACGVCGGDNSTCVDCDGVINGSKTIDRCGSCLAKSHPNFNSGCLKLGSLRPVSGDLLGGTLITITGAGFKTSTSVVCKFWNSTETE